MSTTLTPQQLRAWARRLKNIDCNGAISTRELLSIADELDGIADEILPKTPFSRHIAITRCWADEVDMPTKVFDPMEAWLGAISAEFEGAAERVNPDTDVIQFDGYGTINFCQGVDKMKLTVTAVLTFMTDREWTENTAHQLIREVFYEEGGVLGDFKIL